MAKIKLNKEQIQALARKIKSEIVNPITEYNDTIRKSSEFVNFAKENKDCKAIEEIFRRNGIEQYDLNNAQNRIRNKYFCTKFKREPSINLDSLYDTITLESIWCEDLNSLIATVSEKYRDSSTKA